MKQETIVSNSSLKMTQRMFKEWLVSATIMKQAMLHSRHYIKKLWFSKFVEGILLSQISTQKNQKAQKFRDSHIKFDLLWFLHEYRYEQVARRQINANKISKAKL
mgnify:CR=1 FL=1